jgi:hypothetical protein
MLDKLDKRPKIGLMTGWSDKLETKDKAELIVDFIIKKPFDFLEIKEYINDAFSADSRW